MVESEYRPEQDPALGQETGGPRPSYYLHRACLQSFYKVRLATVQQQQQQAILEADALEEAGHCGGSQASDDATDEQSQLVGLGCCVFFPNCALAVQCYGDSNCSAVGQMGQLLMP